MKTVTVSNKANTFEGEISNNISVRGLSEEKLWVSNGTDDR